MSDAEWGDTTIHTFESRKFTVNGKAWVLKRDHRLVNGEGETGGPWFLHRMLDKWFEDYKPVGMFSTPDQAVEFVREHGI